MSALADQYAAEHEALAVAIQALGRLSNTVGRRATLGLGMGTPEARQVCSWQKRVAQLQTELRAMQVESLRNQPAIAARPAEPFQWKGQMGADYTGD